MKRILIALIFFAGCTGTRESATVPVSNIQTNPPMVVSGKLFSSIYQQQAEEYEALCFQAFNLARLRLDEALKTKSERNLAIITDIDETILDNSAYAIHRGKQGLDYDPLSWSQWIERVEADTVPGALSFLKYAHSKGVEVFYITNRDEKDRNGTQKNLEIFNFPNADSRHLIMRESTSSKELRRREVMGAFNVVLLLGDNLADFSSDFDKVGKESRETAVRKMAREFGDRFILIPNPVYGDWESALYQYNNNYSLQQRDSILKNWGKAY